MPPTKKEEKLTIKAFKNGSQNWWLNMKHWTLLNGELILCAGGIEDSLEREHILKYLKTKKLL